MHDLTKQIDIWIKKGDHIIVMGDLNDYIYKQRLKYFY